jgi:putative FmdB family regulatory protein
MPIYEYVCRNCGHDLEQLQKISEPVLTDCPACGQSSLKRKVSAAGFRLAGGGWYETDFKADKRRNVAGGEEKSEAKTENGSGEKAAGAKKPEAAADSTGKKSDAGNSESKAPAKKDRGAGQSASSKASPAD